MVLERGETLFQQNNPSVRSHMSLEHNLKKSPTLAPIQNKPQNTS
jgi:hypothetical protein